MQLEKRVPISPQGLLVHFNPSGNGRDLYIQHGENKPIMQGNHPEKIPRKADFKMSHPNKMKKDSCLPNFSKPPAVTKYSLDGQGRDNYIGGNNGGFERPENYNPHNFFKRLRAKDHIPKRVNFSQMNVDLRVRRLKLDGQIEVPKVDFSNVINRLNKPRDKTETREGRRYRRLRAKSQGFVNNSYSQERNKDYVKVDGQNTSIPIVAKPYDLANTNFYKTCAQNTFANIHNTNQKNLMNQTFCDKPVNNLDLIKNDLVQTDRPAGMKPNSRIMNRRKLKEQTKGGYFMPNSNSVPIKRCVISRIFNDDLCV